jgi:hypothetical protein
MSEGKFVSAAAFDHKNRAATAADRAKSANVQQTYSKQQKEAAGKKCICSSD